MMQFIESRNKLQNIQKNNEKSFYTRNIFINIAYV